MSARMPFLPFGGGPQRSTTAGSGNGPIFVPNSGNALHRSSGQQDSQDTLPIAGLLGPRPNRTTSHSGPASKNLVHLAGANLTRSQSTAPGNYNAQETNLMPANGNPDNRIRTPTLIHATSPLLTSPTIGPGGFKAPAPLHFTDSLQTSPDKSMALLGFPSAHISNEMQRHQHITSAAVPVRQQPSPDSSDQSGTLEGRDMQRNVAASFRTSTPHARNGHGADAGLIQPQRVFPQDYDAEYGHFFALQQQMSTNRKHSRERYDNDQAQPSKRQRNTHDSQMRTNTGHPASVSTSVNDDRYTAEPPRQSVLSQILGCDAERLLQNQLEHFSNRVSIWQAASDEEWEEGAEELKQRFNNMLQKTQDYMKRKRDLITTLESRINTHQDLLRDREQALMVTRESLVSESQNVLGGKCRV